MQLRLSLIVRNAPREEAESVGDFLHAKAQSGRMAAPAAMAGDGRISQRVAVLDRRAYSSLFRDGTFSEEGECSCTPVG